MAGTVSGMLTFAALWLSSESIGADRPRELDIRISGRFSSILVIDPEGRRDGVVGARSVSEIPGLERVSDLAMEDAESPSPIDTAWATTTFTLPNPPTGTYRFVATLSESGHFEVEARGWAGSENVCGSSSGRDAGGKDRFVISVPVLDARKKSCWVGTVKIARMKSLGRFSTPPATNAPSRD